MRPLAAIVLTLCLPLFSAEDRTGIGVLTLRDMSRGRVTLPLSNNRATVVVFVSVICPMSVDYGARLATLYNDYSRRGVAVLFVDSNSNEADSEVQRQTANLGLPSAIYRDPNGSAAGLSRHSRRPPPSFSIRAALSVTPAA